MAGRSVPRKCERDSKTSSRTLRPSAAALGRLITELRAIHRATSVQRSRTTTFEEHERALIADALRNSLGNQAAAAIVLGIGRDKLRYKMRKYRLGSAESIDAEQFKDDSGKDGDREKEAGAASAAMREPKCILHPDGLRPMQPSHRVTETNAEETVWLCWDKGRRCTFDAHRGYYLRPMQPGSSGVPLATPRCPTHYRFMIAVRRVAADVDTFRCDEPGCWKENLRQG